MEEYKTLTILIILLIIFVKSQIITLYLGNICSKYMDILYILPVYVFINAMILRCYLNLFSELRQQKL